MAQNATTGNPLYLAFTAAAALLLAFAPPLTDQTDDPPDEGPPIDALPTREFWVADSFGHDTVPWEQCTPTNPFKTLDHARLEVRAYRAAGHNYSHDIVVHIAGGLYPLAAPVIFGPEDGGWPGRPITYIAWDPDGTGGVFSDDVLFSGGVRVGGGGAGGNWTPVNINAGTPWATSAYACPVPTSITDIRDVWVNNERMVRARFPNIQPCTTLPQNYASPTTPPCPNQGFMLVKDVEAVGNLSQPIQRVTIRIADASGAIPVPANNNWSSVELIGHRIYVNPQQRIGPEDAVSLNAAHTQASIEFNITTVPTGQPGDDDHMDLGGFGVFRWNAWQQNPGYSYDLDYLQVSGEDDQNPGAGFTARFPPAQVFLSNNLAFIDAGSDKEWYFDALNHTLYLKLCGNPDAINARVVVPAAQQLLVLNVASYLTFQGLDWAHTHQPMPTQADGITPGYATTQGGLQWLDAAPRFERNNIVKPAIEMRAAFDCRLTRCRIAHTGGSAVVIGTGSFGIDSVLVESHYNQVNNCEIFDIGGHGVYIGDEFGARAGSWSTTPSVHNFDPSEGNIIVNSKIDGFGVTYKDSVGVYLGHCRDATVADNEIAFGNWAAFSIGGILQAHKWDPPFPFPTGECAPNVRRPQNGEGAQILRNNIHNVLLKLNDGGLYTQGSNIPSLVTGANSTLDGNYIHDIVLNPYLNFGPANFIGMYFEAGSDGWRVWNNYIARTQRPFHFGYADKPLSGVCSDQPSIFRCASGQPGDNVFGASTWPVPWDEQCGAFPHHFEGQHWDPAKPNYWLDVSVTSGAYGRFIDCRGSPGMRENPNVTNANLQIVTPLAPTHPIVANAGPDDPAWFYPNIQPRRQIHRTPLCSPLLD